jgi:hypothetical protein
MLVLISTQVLFGNQEVTSRDCVLWITQVLVICCVIAGQLFKSVIVVEGHGVPVGNPLKGIRVRSNEFISAAVASLSPILTEWVLNIL